MTDSKEVSLSPIPWPEFHPPRGFPVAVIGDRDESKYRCNHCKLILRNPIQSYCGHRYCRECIVHLSSSGEEVVCPSCISEQTVTEESLLDISRIFPDNATKREVYKLPAICPNTGCVWEGIIREFEKHERDCVYRVEQCMCGGIFSPDEFIDHITNHCPLRPISCDYCRKKFQFKSIQAHLSICPRFPVTCHRCLREGIPREQMESHLLQPECKPRVRCPYGCGHPIEKSDMDSHVHGSARLHLDAVWKSLSTLNERMDQELGTIKAGIDSSSPGYEAEGAVGGIDRRSEEKMEEGEAELKYEVFEGAIDVLQQEMQITQKKIDELLRQRHGDAEKIAVLERMLQTLNMPSAASSGMSLEDLPNFGGSLLWRISNFMEKRQQAITGIQPGITSPPFYTSRTGYKMCGRVYLDGDGMGKGSHLSVFIVVMKGDYDALLTWPFRQKVTMTLLDQGKKKLHVTDAFRPDPSSASFQQPRSEMNTASGCPMFVTLQDILTPNTGKGDSVFLNDDTIFIKLHVDTSNLSGV